MAAASSEETAFAELEKIAEGSPADTSKVGQTEVKQETGGKETVKAVPYSRFQEVISQKNEFQNKAVQYEQKVGEYERTIANLTTMLKETKESDDMIKEIRSLAHDPRHKPYVEYLHKVLMGEEPEVEEEVEEDLSPQEVEDRRIQHLLKSQENLEEVIMDQRADAIIQKADSIADKWLEALPEEYTDEDRNSVAHLWTTRVDWNSIEANPTLIEQELARSFQDTLNLYGTPRGTLFTSEQVEELKKTTTEEAKAPSPEEELAQLFNKNYGGFKPSGKKNSAGAEIMTPEVSDEDFAKEFAQAMKLVNKSRR